MFVFWYYLHAILATQIDMEPNQQQKVWGSVLPASSFWRFNCEGDWLHDEKRMDPLPGIRRGKPRLSFSHQHVSDLCISCIGILYFNLFLCDLMFNVRWEASAGSTAGCQDTTMEGTGHCGSSPCLDAPTPLKSSKKSMSAKRHIQMLTSVAWHSTTSTRVSAWLLSFKNLATEALVWV